MENIHRLIATIKDSNLMVDARLCVTEDNGKWEAEVQFCSKSGGEWRGYGVRCSPAVEYAGTLMEVIPLLDIQCHTVLVALDEEELYIAQKRAGDHP